jgi:hypothetical protein
MREAKGISAWRNVVDSESANRVGYDGSAGIRESYDRFSEVAASHAVDGDACDGSLSHREWRALPGETGALNDQQKHDEADDHEPLPQPDENGSASFASCDGRKLRWSFVNFDAFDFGRIYVLEPVCAVVSELPIYKNLNGLRGAIRYSHARFLCTATPGELHPPCGACLTDENTGNCLKQFLRCCLELLIDFFARDERSDAGRFSKIEIVVPVSVCESCRFTWNFSYGYIRQALERLRQGKVDLSFFAGLDAYAKFLRNVSKLFDIEHDVANWNASDAKCTAGYRGSPKGRAPNFYLCSVEALTIGCDVSADRCSLV